MRMVFFSGTSAVGKSELTQMLIQRDDHVLIPMTARAVREKIGNPKWEDLLADQAVAERHQNEVFESFKRTIATAANTTEKRTMVFERSLLDVAGYSSAFGCSSVFTVKQQEEYEIFIESLLSEGIKIVTVCCWSWPEIPYVQTPERPPESVRDDMEEYLIMVNSLVGTLKVERPDDTITPPMLFDRIAQAFSD